jgi:exonuclease III
VPFLTEKRAFQNDLGKTARISSESTTKTITKRINIKKLNFLRWLFNIVNDWRASLGWSPRPRGPDTRSTEINGGSINERINKWISSIFSIFTSEIPQSNDYKILSNPLSQVAKVLETNFFNGKSLETGPAHSSKPERNKIPTLNDLKYQVDPKSVSIRNFLRQSINPIIISTYIILSLIIYLLLIQQSVEINPGPKLPPPEIVSIVSYNTNGLGDTKKLRRTLKKAEVIVNKGGIVMLQETHLKDDKYLKSLWKNKVSLNCKSSNSAGLATLYNNEYNLEEEFSDEEGRQLVIAISKEGEKLIVANCYYPNDHKQSIAFTNDMCEKIIQFQQNHPDAETIYAGDFNMCVSNDEDSLNRNKTKQEDDAAKLLTQNNIIIEVRDAYRHKFPTGGFTWNRGKCYSRLDYVFMSNRLIQRLSSARTDWAFENSDHAAVIIRINQVEQITKGPGLVKINSEILKNPTIAKQVEDEVTAMMEQADATWNPHLKLEFLKVCIRTVFANKVNEQRKFKRTEIEELEEELNQIENTKIKLVRVSDESSEFKQNISKFEVAIINLKSLLLKLRTNLSENCKFKTNAKWFEYGEKSNKFFLNLNKCRQKQRLIHKIKNSDKEYKGQDEVQKCIKNFYQDLYASKPIDRNIPEDNFYINCPKLSPENKFFMDEPITLKDLTEAIKTCKDSAPGPDGIPYAVYKSLWKLTGQTILDSWNYSLQSGSLAPSHIESIITLLPKEGKDAEDIKNWRPITLSNCDSKIITKAMANKMSKILKTIIDPTQTAYIPGRSVSDNLRSNYFLKNHCRKKNIDSVLISLDAKKAFDSVDHEYIKNTLAAYGFGESFIRSFEVLYRDITARILVNGYTTESIKIQRGVKQGDALSCAIFIICIDPLIRNLNKNDEIKEIRIHNNRKVHFKAAAFADDISVICNNNPGCIQQVFSEYERLTIRSGLELNADKTEILILNSNEIKKLKFTYNKTNFEITSVNKLKICGLFYCNSQEEEYRLNVKEKINKLSNKIRIWSHRHLTMEGKTLIVKTFGLSQLIYNMQSYDFKREEEILTERIIFKFLWSNSEVQNGVDRVKRSIMKNSFSKGGMKVTDVESLNRSLKLKQFIRAQQSDHMISEIQSYLAGSKELLREYKKVTEEEAICTTAQETINFITDSNRSYYNNLTEEKRESNKLLIDEVSAIDLNCFLTRRNEHLAKCFQGPLIGRGITTLGDLTQALEYEKEKEILKSMNFVAARIPKHLLEISRYYNENINSDSGSMRFLMVEPNKWMKVESITVKQLQETLKRVTNKTEDSNFTTKLEIENFDEENIVKFRKTCKNPKLRNIYFRLIHNDFYTHAKMKKYKMTTTDNCPRCGAKEDTKHLLWNCIHAKTIWSLYNSLMKSANAKEVEKYEDIFIPGTSYAICLIKIKLIQEMIQIDRPMNWIPENITNIITNLMKIEQQNAMNDIRKSTYHKNWSIFLTINN